MSISSVVNDFLNKGMECSINRFESNSKFMKKEKNILLGSPYKAKTQLFRVRFRNIIIVTGENNIVSNRKFRGNFKTNPKELSNSEIMAITGHPKGGLSPFGLKTPLKVYVDISLKGHNNIYLCAGLKNFVVTVNYKEVINLTSGEWIDICEEN